ncbi:MAG: AAA family ATPase, partial [Clostridiaceae bacterium]|nr:AAA family ATPase [Clostridiaceae bacterium]
KRQLAEFERKAIIKALRENKYNLTKAADQIGYTRSNLQYRIKILDIN